MDSHILLPLHIQKPYTTPNFFIFFSQGARLSCSFMLNIVFSNSFEGFLKVFHRFSLDIGFFLSVIFSPVVVPLGIL